MLKGVVLTGFMGAGKTSVGRALAKRLGLPWFDTDACIEKVAGKTITEIFAQEGEPAFREMEHRCLLELAPKMPAVVSTGGGIVMRPENWPALRALGPLVYLRAKPDTLYGRVRRHRHRPLLQTNDPRAAFDRLFAMRRPFYEQADLVLDTDELRPEEAAARLARMLENQPSDIE